MGANYVIDGGLITTSQGSGSRHLTPRLGDPAAVAVMLRPVTEQNAACLQSWIDTIRSDRKAVAAAASRSQAGRSRHRSQARTRARRQRRHRSCLRTP